MITYSTNWMGPVGMDWYFDRDLTQQVVHTVESEQQRDILRRRRPDIEIGDTFVQDEIITYYSAGRIDIRDDTKQGYDGWDEYSVAPMNSEDWNALSDYLDDLTTKEQLSYNTLIEQFETHYGKRIRWAEEKNT